MGKRNAITKDQTLKTANNKTTNLVFILIIVLFTFFLYGNTRHNGYALDDYIIKGQDQVLVKEGISSIGDIFTTTYTSKTGQDGQGQEMSFGYRPVVRAVFALEYSLFGLNPWAGHMINVLIYLIMVLILYHLLKRLFRDYSIWFPFLVTLLFIAIPVHTEVVASLKNRDEMLAMLFSLLSLQQFIRYADKQKVISLILGLLLYVIAFLSKPTALTFWMVIPLTLYFFTDLKWKKIGIIFGLVTLMIFLAGIVPFMFMERARDFSFIENPLYHENSIWHILGTGMYILGYYVKILVVQHPLLYYYGFDMIPVVNLGNIWVILSIVFYVGILIIAIRKFREKHVISYAILFYLLTIAMFANIVSPAPGIIAERFLLIPSLGFVMIIAWLIFKVFKADPGSKFNSSTRIFFVMLIGALVLLAYSFKTINRNKQWKSEETLYKADMPYLENSVKAHDLLGNLIWKQVNVELAKPVNVAKFFQPKIDESLGHFQRAIEIYPEHSSSWRNMGMIYNHPRILEHYLASGDTAKAIFYKNSAISSFHKAMELDPEDGKAVFNLGRVYEDMGRIDSAIYYYQECVRMNPNIINPRSRLADLYFFSMGDMNKALDQNKEIMQRHPNEAMPYVSLGIYLASMGDGEKAEQYFQEALKRNIMPDMLVYISRQYANSGDSIKAEYYKQKFYELSGPSR